MNQHPTCKRRALPLITLSIALSLAGCGSPKEMPKQPCAKSQGPGFGSLRRVYYNDKTKKACLTVNAKNSMGGYTGDQQATLIHEKDDRIYVTSREISAETCREIHADLVD